MTRTREEEDRILQGYGLSQKDIDELSPGNRAEWLKDATWWEQPAPEAAPLTLGSWPKREPLRIKWWKTVICIVLAACFVYNVLTTVSMFDLIGLILTVGLVALLVIDRVKIGRFSAPGWAVFAVVFPAVILGSIAYHTRFDHYQPNSFRHACHAGDFHCQPWQADFSSYYMAHSRWWPF
jgi:hypothetical protein